MYHVLDMAFPDFMGTFFMCPTVLYPWDPFFFTLGGPVAEALALGLVGIVLIADIFI